MTNYNWNWSFKNTVFAKNRGKVFSCFSCGGGSTMGYKLACFDVIGCNEIDPRMMNVYIKNHNPDYPFLAPIQEFKNYDNLPEELYDLDILDGSPPCSSFSMAGSREKDWGKKKKFKEGQAEQILDTLFFDYIELGAKLQPKVITAENVKGLLQGAAIDYVRKIYDAFDKAGYYVQHFLLDSSKMGVPQRRERVFFIALRKDLAGPFLFQKDMFTQIPMLNLDFNESPIEFWNVADYKGREITGEKTRHLWESREFGDANQSDANIRLFGKNKGFGQTYVYLDRVCSTLTSKEDSLLHYEKPHFLGEAEVCKISTFPNDYDFNGLPPHYVCGMSVPPIMVARIANEIYNQWLVNL